MNFPVRTISGLWNSGPVHLTYDAHLAALAIEGGWTLASTDNDRRRFTGVQFINPVFV